MIKPVQDRAATRERILEATYKLVQTTAPSAFKVADVANDAGVSPSLVIQYFNTKDELVFEALLRQLERFGPRLADPFLRASSKKGVWDFLKAAMQRDIEVRHLGRDVLSYSWRWSADNEARFEAAIAPRYAALAACLKRDAPALAEDPALFQSVLTLISDVHHRSLRRSHVHGWTLGETMRDLAFVLQPALAAYGIKPPR